MFYCRLIIVRPAGQPNTRMRPDAATRPQDWAFLKRRFSAKAIPIYCGGADTLVKPQIRRHSEWRTHEPTGAESAGRPVCVESSSRCPYPPSRFTTAGLSFLLCLHARLIRVRVGAALVAEDDRLHRTLDGFATVSTQSPASGWPNSDTRGSLNGSVVASAASRLVPILTA
jgi:hypothetical protein